jgi:hypothetical protein
MATMHFHSVHILLIAVSAWNRARDDARRPNALTTDSILAIVMAAAATEAFANEFAEYAQSLQKDSVPPETPWEKLQLAAAEVTDIEDQRGKIEEKYTAMWLALSGQHVNRGAAPYQDFANLIGLRNAIMHVKAAREDEAHTGTRITEALTQRRIALEAGSGQLAWFDRLETPAVAGWACEAARAIILGVLDLVPDGRPCVDPLRIWKRHFREHYANVAPQDT